MRHITAIVIALIFGAAANAQNKELIDAIEKLDVKVFKPDSPDAKLRWDAVRQLRDSVNKKDVEAWRKIKTKADWEAFRSKRLVALNDSLGKFPPISDKAIKVVMTKKLEGDGFIVQNVIYESQPNFYVTANLYGPDKSAGKMPGIIVIHSHHNPKTQGELQDMGILWARQGCVVLVPDMVGHGERRAHPFPNAASFPDKFAVSRQDYWFRYNTAMQTHLVGGSLVGWMVWDLMRGVDLLIQQPNVDDKKIIALGSVAGGGDPCAVFAALDTRVAAAAPFNFGGPQPETKFPLPDDSDLAFNYMGGASWESTRNLRLSGRDGFLPWLVVGSIAPRGLIYGHEFAWDQDRDPVWKRFNTIWGDFYGAKDKLAFAKGRGSVKGQAPESTHCNNIGFEHRKPMYPTFKKWFDLPIPEENKKRFDSSELQCWTEDARKTLKPKMVHERAAALADGRKIDLNDPDLESVYESLRPHVGDDMAKFVVLCRLFGPSSSRSKSTIKAEKLSDYKYEPSNRLGVFAIRSPFDLIEARVMFKKLVNKKQVVTVAYDSPLNDLSLRSDLLEKLFSVAKVDDPPRADEDFIHINVATAPITDLAKLFPSADVERIVTARNSLSAAKLDTPAWLHTQAQVSLAALHDASLRGAISSKAKEKPATQDKWLKLLGVNSLADLACKSEPVSDQKLPGGYELRTEVLRREKIALPVTTISPAGARRKTPVVIALAQDGKAGFFKHRADMIARLLDSGVAVCLPDLRATGETANDGRNRTSGATSYSASLQMHGLTVPGVQLQELVMLMRELTKQGYGPIALWGDSFVEPNAADTKFAVPYDAKLPRQAEPMGGTLALLGGVFGGDNVKAIYVRGGMVSFRSMLDSSFCYFPHDAVIPGVLSVGDLDGLAEANAKRGLRLESLVDGLNRRVDDKTLKTAYKGAMFSRPAHDLMVLRAEQSSSAEVAAWLAARVKK